MNSFLPEPCEKNFFFLILTKSQARWLILVIPALGKLRREDHEFKANLGYIVRPCLKKKNFFPKQFIVVYKNHGKAFLIIINCFK
jgi:hypothetical protein